MKNKTSITILAIIITGLLVVILFIKYKTPQLHYWGSLENPPTPSIQETYTYTNHGFSIELPKGFVPQEVQSEGGPTTVINLPKGILSYVTNSAFWEKNVIPSYTYIKDEKNGETIFKRYSYSGKNIYWFKKGNVGYEYQGDPNQLQTFKFVGWPQVSVSGTARTSDLISFSVSPGQEISGKVTATGKLQGAYFFEGNIGVNILDANKKVLKPSYGTATSEWMTAGPVSFSTDLDFTGLPKGPGYVVIMNDNAEGLPEKDKNIFIPIVIK